MNLDKVEMRFATDQVQTEVPFSLTIVVAYAVP